ncbi:hypothetical protein MLD38_030591 [Melastoma candidum]|uniref:Uncharacterized protein n=1 Tax=Melastoma candidum TaxID=119954 RepID=A0ACB9MNM8_9MYRT|nr:hypothetical protein MLD38_030591 [Melastoma candidum]
MRTTGTSNGVSSTYDAVVRSLSTRTGEQTHRRCARAVSCLRCRTWRNSSTLAMNAGINTYVLLPRLGSWSGWIP